MKNKELVTKYTKLIGALLNIPHTDVGIQIKLEGEWQSIGEEYKIPEKDDYEMRLWQEGEYRVRHLGLERELEKYPLKRGEIRYTTIGEWKLYRMPHCCAIMISCNALVNPPFQNKGVGTILNNLRQEISRYLGYSLLMCTDISSNTPQRKLLKTNGWKDIHSVINKRTNNTVHVSVINL